MMNDSVDWLCPFCVTSWICDGPHIESKDIQSFIEYMYYAKEDHVYTCIDEIEKYERKYKVDLNELKTNVIQKMIERDR